MTLITASEPAAAGLIRKGATQPYLAEASGGLVTTLPIMRNVLMAKQDAARQAILTSAQALIPALSRTGCAMADRFTTAAERFGFA